MRNRQIRLNGNLIDKVAEKQGRVKDLLKASFTGTDEATLLKFVEFLDKSGWTVADIESAAKQYSNAYRPAVLTSLVNSAPAIDVVLRNQEAYTNFKDTADDPNYAIRARGNSELLIRRMSYGDLLMLQASHDLEASQSNRNAQSTDLNENNYWNRLRPKLMRLLIPENYRSAYNDVIRSPATAAATAFNFMRTSACDYPVLLEGSWSDSISHIIMSLTAPSSPYYVGCGAEYLRIREPRGVYKDKWVIEPHFTGDEGLSKAACNVVCMVLNWYATAYTNGDLYIAYTSIGDTFIEYLRRHGVVESVEKSNGDKT